MSVEKRPPTPTPIVVVVYDPRQGRQRHVAETLDAAGLIAIDELATMWRRPGATMRIEVGPARQVIWTWEGWAGRAHSWNQWRAQQKAAA